jgi:hypothetical protein
MNNHRVPEARDRLVSPLPRFSEVRPSDELRKPDNAALLMLFKIVKKAGQNLDNELCPENPKSIWTKARDLARNVPHWYSHVGKLKVSGDGAIDLRWAEGLVRDLLNFLESIINQLAEHVAKQVRNHPSASDALDSLKKYLHGVLGHIDREVTSEHRQLGAANTADVATGIVTPLPEIQ